MKHSILACSWMTALCSVIYFLSWNESLLAQDTRTSYEATIAEGNRFFKSGNLDLAYKDTVSAMAQDPTRFQAYALAALPGRRYKYQ